MQDYKKNTFLGFEYITNDRNDCKKNITDYGELSCTVTENKTGF